MNILALDYGTKRIGLAWSDTTLGVILPFGVIEKPNVKAKVKELAELLFKEKIQKVIVGYPLSLNGKENANTERIKKFVFELQKSTNVEVEYYDERFSSYGADAVGGGVSRDEKSAMIILESYLQRQKKK
jgi:putative Holliday junction resolvase